METSIHSRLQDYLDAAVLLVTECLVHLGAAFERLGVSNHEGRVNLIFEHPVEQVISPSVHVGLPGADGQSLVHDGAQRNFVQQAAIDTWYRKNARGTADIHHLAKHVRTIGFQHHGLFGTVVHRIDRAGRMCLKANSVDALFRTLASGKLVQSLYDTFLFEVDRDRASRSGHGKAFRKAIDCDDLPGAEQYRAPDCHLTHGTAAPNRDSICRLDVALNRRLPAGREYVGQKQQLFVGDAGRDLDMRGIGKGDTQIFGLAAGITAGQMGVPKQSRGRMAERVVSEILVAVRRLADGEVSAPALFAFAANDGEGYDDPVPDLERFPCRRPASTTSPMVSWPMTSPDFMPGMK